MESVEYYATILMNTGSILKQANELSERQVSELLKIRENLGIKSGGVPAGAQQESNTRDVVDSRPGTAVLQENQYHVLRLARFSSRCAFLLSFCVEINFCIAITLS